MICYFFSFNHHIFSCVPAYHELYCAELFSLVIHAVSRGLYNTSEIDKMPNYTKNSFDEGINSCGVAINYITNLVYSNMGILIITLLSIEANVMKLVTTAGGCSYLAAVGKVGF